MNECVITPTGAELNASHIHNITDSDTIAALRAVFLLLSNVSFYQTRPELSGKASLCCIPVLLIGPVNLWILCSLSSLFVMMVKRMKLSVKC